MRWGKRESEGRRERKTPINSHVFCPFVLGRKKTGTTFVIEEDSFFLLHIFITRRKVEDKFAGDVVRLCGSRLTPVRHYSLRKVGLVPGTAFGRGCKGK